MDRDLATHHLVAVSRITIALLYYCAGFPRDMSTTAERIDAVAGRGTMVPCLAAQGSRLMDGWKSFQQRLTVGVELRCWRSCDLLMLGCERQGYSGIITANIIAWMRPKTWVDIRVLPKLLANRNLAIELIEENSGSAIILAAKLKLQLRSRRGLSEKR
jgi:hypothetical protein